MLACGSGPDVTLTVREQNTRRGRLQHTCRIMQSSRAGGRADRAGPGRCSERMLEGSSKAMEADPLGAETGNSSIHVCNETRQEHLLNLVPCPRDLALINPKGLRVKKG